MQTYQRLEAEFAEWVDWCPPENMVTCSSGSAALVLALEAMQLPRGSDVIVPDFTMVACPRAVAIAGLRPVFADCDKRLLLDPDKVLESAKISAIMPVHIYGRRCDMDALYQLGVPVVEDLAEAHGVKPHVGTDAACWSFYRNKIVAGEEGGAVAFRDAEHARLARQLRSLGFTDAHDYWHVPCGHNYRMSNLHATPILRSLRACRESFTWSNGDVGTTQEVRRRIEAWYDAACPSEWQQPPRNAVWVFDIRIPGMSVEKQTAVVSALRTAGIEARHGFKPCRRQEEWADSWRAVGPREWESDRASREVIYLPVQPGWTTEADCRRAFDVVQSALKSQSLLRSSAPPGLDRDSGADAFPIDIVDP